MDKKEWLEKLRKSRSYSWCTDDQWECCQMVFDLIGGENHLYSRIRSWGTGIAYNTLVDFATFDSNILTTGVFMAHDRCIRLSVRAGYNKMIQLCLWKRHSRNGNITERHPTLNQAIEEYRKYYPEAK